MRGSNQSAYGSAFVKLGNTSVMCGIRAEIGLTTETSSQTNPFNEGHLVVNLEMLPLCSSFIRSSKPNEKSLVTSQSLNEIGQKLIDPSNLFVGENEGNGFKAAWYLYADLYCFEYDGNIFDVSLISLLTALANVKLPKIEITPEGEACVQVDDRPISIILNYYPISTTFGIFEESLIVDPNLEEEGLLNGTLTIVQDEKEKIYSFIKVGGSEISETQINECFKISLKRSKHVFNLIEKTKKK